MSICIIQKILDGFLQTWCWNQFNRFSVNGNWDAYDVECWFQVAATTNREIDGHIPNYPSLPPSWFSNFIMSQCMWVYYLFPFSYVWGMIAYIYSKLSELKYVLIFRQMLKRMKYMLKWHCSHWLRYPFVLWLAQCMCCEALLMILELRILFSLWM